MAFDKTRIRFRKDGDLRLVSHLDLMRSFERLLRRAELPFRSTEGFHPQPRVVFAQSLPLGIAGLQEVVEIEWTRPLEPDEVLERLVAQAPPGLSFHSAKRIELKQSARPHRAVYRLLAPVDEVAPYRNRCAEIMNATEFWVPRERPRPREINIRPYIRDLRASDALEMDIWLTQEGSARADEIVRGLGAASLLDAGCIIVRAELHIEDELNQQTLTDRPAMPLREQRAALERPLPVTTELTPLSAAHAAHWSASSDGPVVE